MLVLLVFTLTLFSWLLLQLSRDLLAQATLTSHQLQDLPPVRLFITDCEMRSCWAAKDTNISPERQKIYFSSEKQTQTGRTPHTSHLRNNSKNSLYNIFLSTLSLWLFPFFPPYFYLFPQIGI